MRLNVSFRKILFMYFIFLQNFAKMCKYFARIHLKIKRQYCVNGASIIICVIVGKYYIFSKLAGVPFHSFFTLGRSYYLLRFFESHKGVGRNHHTVNGPLDRYKIIGCRLLLLLVTIDTNLAR
jgi:hypothetical protein